jgi:hypothetical protein
VQFALVVHLPPQVWPLEQLGMFAGQSGDDRQSTQVWVTRSHFCVPQSAAVRHSTQVPFAVLQTIPFRQPVVAVHVLPASAPRPPAADVPPVPVCPPVPPSVTWPPVPPSEWLAVVELLQLATSATPPKETTINAHTRLLTRSVTFIFNSCPLKPRPSRKARGRTCAGRGSRGASGRETGSPTLRPFGAPSPRGLSRGTLPLTTRVQGSTRRRSSRR